MRNFLFTLFWMMAALCAGAQPGTLDTVFDPGDVLRKAEEGANNTIRTIAVQSDGRIWIGGDFTTYNGYTSKHSARLAPDGTLDGSFLGGANAPVYALVPTSQGNTLMGGAFTDYNGNWYRDYLLQFTREGGTDANFDTGDGAGSGEGANGTVIAITLQADGKVLIGGEFTQYNHTTRSRIARLNMDGSLDLSFDPGSGANGPVTCIALQPDGKILIGGSFTTYNGVARNSIARLNADGSLDAGFNTGGGANNTIHTIALQNNGKILIGGAFTMYRGVGCSHITRLNSDGSVDPSFNASFNGAIHTISLQGDGKILIGGAFTTYNGAPRNYIVRINGNGSVDGAFTGSSGTNGPVTALALQSDGRILIGGSFTACNGTARNRIARLSADGSLDDSFYPGRRPNGTFYALGVRKDTRIIAGGELASYNGTSRRNIALFDARGGLSTQYFANNYVGVNGTVTSVLFPTDSTTLIAGSFTSFFGSAANRIVRLNPYGVPDKYFTPGSGADNTIYAMALQSDGKILAGGDFTTYNGTPRNRVARLNANGTLDASFNPGSGANGRIKALAVQRDGSILIGGEFTAYNGVACNGLARLAPDGSLDASFTATPAPGSRIEALAVQDDDKIMAGGTFTSFNNTTAPNLIRLQSDGAPDASFNPGKGAIGTVHALLLQSDGRLLVGGAFPAFNDGGSRGIARLDVDGSLDTSFHPGTGANGTVYAIALDANSDILIGGDFSAYDGRERQRIARLHGGLHSLTLGPLSAISYCANSELPIPFTATGAYTKDHEFVAQLSNPLGSFEAGTTTDIGSLRSTSSGTIRALLPPGTAAGNRYRVRVVSYAPALTSADNGFNLTVRAVPDTPTITVSGDTAICRGGSTVLTASAAVGLQWYKDSTALPWATAQRYTATEPGRYSVGTMQNYCSSALSAAVIITMKPAPEKPLISQEGATLTVSVASGVQWYKDGVAISGATGARYTVQASGLYSVRVTQNGCSTQSDAVNMVLTSVGNPTAWDDEVTVYPVPVQEVLHLTNRGLRRLRVQLVDVAGKKIRETQVFAPAASLAMEDVTPGTYLLLITDQKKGETLIRTIVKQ